MDEPRFYIIAWAGRMKYGMMPDMSKYHLVDTLKESKLFNIGGITGCGRDSCASALIADDMDFGESIADKGEPEKLSDLDQVTCRPCRKSKTYQEVEEILSKKSLMNTSQR